MTEVKAALPKFGLPASRSPTTVLRWPARSRQGVHVLPAGDRQNDFAIGCVALLVRVVEPRSLPQLGECLVAPDPQRCLGSEVEGRRDLRTSLETGLAVCLTME